jgi:hypothetical protein
VRGTVTAAPGAKSATPAASKETRLRAQIVLHRRQGERTIASRPYSVVLLAGDEKAANVFSGSQLPLEVTNQGQPTIALKDVGAGARLTAQLLADGSYRLDLNFTDGSLSAAKGSPSVHVFQAESRLLVRTGETVRFASAVDPQTGEVVDVEVTIDAAR